MSAIHVTDFHVMNMMNYVISLSLHLRIAADNGHGTETFRSEGPT